MNEEEEDAFEDRRTKREENDKDEIQENIQETRKNKVPTETIKHRLRKKDDIKPPERYGDFIKHSSFIAIHDVPSTFEEATQKEDAKEWKLAMQEKLEAHKKNGTWKLVKSPQNVTVMQNK